MDLFDLYAKLSMDTSGYEKSMSDSESKTSSFGSKLSSALGTAAKVGAAAIGVASTAVSALVKQSVESFAEYEQLVGGVDTLFKDSSAKVQEYAANAYKTAGMSANDYMETVTSFSASLLQSLDGDTNAAAEKADQAITDMSDNANKMGTDISSIQNAYQGFAKQNYTMLDNLKLGYGGTKEEMERLLSDAEKISGVKYDISSYADVVDAIHVMQESMGIAGTTAKEASTTIEGSVNSTKAAWSNLLTSLATGNGDLSANISTFVDSVKTAASNIIPVAEQALSGIGDLISELTPIIVNELPSLVSTLLPQLINTGVSLVNSVTQALPSILQSLISALPTVLNTINTTLMNNAPMLIQCGCEAIVQMAVGIAQALPDLIPQIVDIILTMVDTLLDNIDLLVDAAITLTVGIATGLIKAIPKIVEKVPTIILKIVEAITRNLPKIYQAGVNIILKLGTSLVENIPKLVKQIPSIVIGIVDAFKDYYKKMGEVGLNLIKGLWEGINDATDWILTKIKGFGNAVLDGIKDFFGIHSPSKEMEWIGEMLDKGLANGIEKYSGLAVDSANALGDDVLGAMNGMEYTTKMSVASNPTTKALDKLLEVNESLPEALADALNNVRLDVNGREFGRLVREYA